MATNHTFGCKLDNGQKVTLSIKRPTTLEDKAWEDLVTGPTDDRINDLAFQNWVIKAQSSIRKARDKAEAEARLARYRYGVGGAGAVALSEDEIEQGEFNEDQLAILRAAGVKV